MATATPINKITSLSPVKRRELKQSEIIPEQTIPPTATFTRYLDAWLFCRQTGCRREIQKTGWNEYTV